MAVPAKKAWNHGRNNGQKRLLLPKYVWAIRVRLELADAVRDLALFNMAVDSKLRGCDLVRLKVADVFSVQHHLVLILKIDNLFLIYFVFVEFEQINVKII